MSKGGTFLHILDVVGHAVDPRVGMAIDAGKALEHAHSDNDRAAALMSLVDESLQVAGDYSGKEAVADPALRALIQKYIKDGMELHAYIEAKKAVAAAPAAPDPAAAAGSSVE